MWGGKEYKTWKFMTEPKKNAVLLKSNGLFLFFLQKSCYTDCMGGVWGIRRMVKAALLTV